MNYKLSLALLVSLVAFQAKAQSVAKPGHECAWEEVVPSLVCMNPEAGADVRLNIMEMQSCKNGNITELDRDIMGMDNKSDSEPVTIDDDNIKVTYASARTHLDDRDGDLTFLLPTAAVMTDGAAKITMKITTKIEPNYEDAPADEWHYAGSFTKVEGGKVTASGKLDCLIAN